MLTVYNEPTNLDVELFEFLALRLGRNHNKEDVRLKTHYSSHCLKCGGYGRIAVLKLRHI